MAFGPAGELATLGVSLVGDGATVDNIHVGGLGERHERMSLGPEAIFDRSGVVLVNLAAQSRDRYTQRERSTLRRAQGDRVSL